MNIHYLGLDLIQCNRKFKIYDSYEIVIFFSHVKRQVVQVCMVASCWHPCYKSLLKSATHLQWTQLCPPAFQINVKALCTDVSVFRYRAYREVVKVN